MSLHPSSCFENLLTSQSPAGGLQILSSDYTLASTPLIFVPGTFIVLLLLLIIITITIIINYYFFGLRSLCELENCLRIASIGWCLIRSQWYSPMPHIAFSNFTFLGLLWLIENTSYFILGSLSCFCQWLYDNLLLDPKPLHMSTLMVFPAPPSCCPKLRKGQSSCLPASQV